jgi:hypothetical protein
MADETFECYWCKISGACTKEEYTYPIDEIGGYDKETENPICQECAYAAMEGKEQK